MTRVRFDVKSEEGNYLVQDVADRGYVNSTIEVEPRELPQLMEELSEETGDRDSMLDALRYCYSHFEIRSIEFHDK